MYLVREEYKKLLVERAKEEHNINTSLLEGYETENIFKKSFIVENLDFKEVDKYDDVSCVFMFSRTMHNINDIFHLFLAKYNIIPCHDVTISCQNSGYRARYWQFRARYRVHIVYIP